ncbi:MAG: ABC transporter ATP-binding protein [Bdellovibrionales bacterium]
MFLTRLYRRRDYVPFIRAGEATPFPTTVGGMVWMTIRTIPFQFFGIMVFTVIVNGLQATLTYAIKKIIDAMNTAPAGVDRIDYVMPAFLLLIAIICARFLAQYMVWTSSYFWRVGRRRMSHRISSYVLAHTPQFFENDLSGRIIQKMVSLYTSTASILDSIMWNWSGAIAFFGTSLVMLGTVDIRLAGIALIWFAVLFGGSRFIGKNLSALAKASNDARSQVVGRIADAIINVRNVLYFARQPEEIDGFARRESEVVNREQFSYLSLLDVRVFNQLMSFAALVGIIGTCIYLWAHDMATLGDISMVSMLAIIVVNRAIDLVENLPEALDQIGIAQDSLDTLVKPRDLVDAPDAQPLQVKAGALKFDDITFTYPGTVRPVFQNFTLDIRAGERIGLVGVSGAGKSTLVALLLRMYDVQRGAVRFDGQDISRVTQDSLRKAVSFIPQDTLLFHRTVRDNIAYGKLDATDEEIITAAKAAQAHGFIEIMPNGYDTMVGERGVKLSGGQRQRIAIARALLKNAPVLLLDEATSALDSEAEVEIQAAIKTAMQGKTVIAIAHRLSTIASLDRLIVMENGHIVEEGTHAQLVAKGGTYAKLWEHQSGGFLGLD